MTQRALTLLFVLALPGLCITRKVGPGQPFAKPCQALTSAVDGDVIEIDAKGVYDGDVCGFAANNLTIRGLGGRAKIDAAGKQALGKGIWVISGNNVTVEHIEFTGARVPDLNGAGIRSEGGNLTVRDCYFHHNENGILGGTSGFVLVEYSEFANNGYGNGYSHNMYVASGVSEFTLRYSKSVSANVGHLVKSRATKNYILYNQLLQLNGTGSYELDLPNAGLAYVVGNILQQGETTQNSGMITFGQEGLKPGVAAHELYVVNNTFVSTRSPRATFVTVAPAVPTSAVIRNNIFSGLGTISTQSSASLSGNVSSGVVGFVDPPNSDYRITAASAALNAGVEPGVAGSYPLRPTMQFITPTCVDARSDVGPIDAGAYEYGSLPRSPACIGTVTPPPPPPNIANFTATPTQVTGAATVTCTLVLTGPAPANGLAVSLISSHPAVAPVQPSVVVPAGQSTIVFAVPSKGVLQPTPITITATSGEMSKQATWIANPAPALPMLSSFSLTYGLHRPDGSMLFRFLLELQQPAPKGGATVRLSSPSPLFSIVSSVKIPEGKRSVPILATAAKVSAPTSATLTATAGNQLTLTVTLLPPAL